MAVREHASGAGTRDMTEAMVFDLGKVVVAWDPGLAVGHLFDGPQALAAELERIDFFVWNAEQDRGRSWEAGFAAAPDAAAERVFRAYRDNIDAAHAVPIAGTVAIIEEMHAAGRPLYALTNGPREATATMREQHGVMARFQDVVISAEERVLKPDPAIYAVLCERNGLAPGECTFVDDSETNVAGARAYGMDAIHFTGPDALRAVLVERGLL